MASNQNGMYQPPWAQPLSSTQTQPQTAVSPQYMQPTQPAYQQNGYFGPNNWQMPVPPQMQRPAIPGRVVNAPEEIMPNEVSMDGTPCFFPMSDGNSVYVKAWGADGTISTKRYVLETVSAQPTSDPMKDVVDRLERIEKKLSNGMNRNRNRQNSAQYKKEDKNV